MGAAVRAAACAALLAASSAAAEGVYGTLQLQYQKAEDRALLVGGDNIARTEFTKRENWIRTLDLHHQEYLRSDLMLESNARFSDQLIVGRPDVARTPYGSLRLLHPRFQFLVSHQPSMNRSTVSSTVAGRPDSSVSRQVTTHSRESMVNGHFGGQGLPQVDLAWVRRQRDGFGSVGDRNTASSARFVLDRERWSTYGGVSDQRVASRVAGSGRSDQQVWTAGGAWRRQLPKRAVSLNAQYDLSAVRARADGQSRPGTTSQSAALGADWRPNRRVINSANYQWRRIGFGTENIAPQADQEASIVSRWAFSPRATLLATTGLRTVRNSLGDGLTRADLQKYAASVLSFDTRIRPRWTLTGGLSNTTNWDPSRRQYSVQTATAASRAQLRRRLTADGTLQVSSNSDSGSAASRYGLSWTARLQGSPLRNLQMTLGLRTARSGPGLLRPRAASRGLVADVNWRIDSRIQVLAQYGSNAQAGGIFGNSTRSVAAKFEPSPRWQWYGSWARADQQTVVSVAGQLSSRETVTARLQYSPSRRLAASAGVSYNDPGRTLESRRIDMAFTWSFGR